MLRADHKKMKRFINDYSQGACKEILGRLVEVNFEENEGYGCDKYCRMAEEKILAECGCPDGQVYFMNGGTQTNQVVIDTMCEPYEGVIAVETGHINTHEAGAIEYSGHKVFALKGEDGKLQAAVLSDFMDAYMSESSLEHMVYPGMVYISHPTELGTLYTKAELKELHDICAKWDIPLYMDGARLGYGLMAEGTDVSLKDIAELTDVFYIGGTKVGSFFGEAVVFPKHNMPKRFNTLVKQHGAMVAKGWLAGLQFDALFTDGLYYECGRNGIETARIIKDALKEKGYEFMIDSPTNQIFVILTNEKFDELKDYLEGNIWSYPDEAHTAVRIVTSWATAEEEVLEYINIY